MTGSQQDLIRKRFSNLTPVVLSFLVLMLIGTALAQTGIDGVDTPEISCSLGQMSYSLNSTTRECKRGNCCGTGFHCGPTFTIIPTLCDCKTFTKTPTPTATATPTATP